MKTLSQLINIMLLGLALLLGACSKRESAVTQPKAEPSLSGVTASPNRVVIDQAVTTQLIRREVTPVVHATGEVTIDPRSISTVSARFDGRIERLYLRYNFQPVWRGDLIMEIYSPQILAEQKRLISLVRTEGAQSELVGASKDKLLNLGLTSDQVDEIVASRKPIDPLPVYSPFSGHIHDVVSRTTATQTRAPDATSAMAAMSGGGSQSRGASSYATNVASSELSTKEGSYVRAGQPLVAVYDASQAWVVLNIARSDASLVHVGDAVTIRAESDLEHPIEAQIDYIEPMLDPNSATLRARVYLSGMTHESAVKIGALVDATITSQPASGAWLPKTSVVRLGKRDVVFVQQDGRFRATEVQTGMQTDSLVQINAGLSDSANVALQAHYFVDGDSFIRTEDAQ